jgi:indole-3-glycerol phosphate synthase
MTQLTEIVRSKQEALRGRRGAARLAELKAKLRDATPARPFLAALAEPPLALIAEIKQASPSAGLLRQQFNPAEIAHLYEDSGARALSVLTDEPFFKGSLEHLAVVRRAVALPLLQKDFVLDEIQLYEARVYGADAILLITAILEPGQIKDLFHLAGDLGLAALVEIHSEKELERVIEWTPIIGINNRDLTTFAVDLETTFRVLKEVPDDRIVVSESGIAARRDVERLAEAGVDAILVGETFMRAENIGAKVKELMGT